MRFFDLHCDTLTRCFDEDRSFYKGGQHVNLQKGRRLDSWCQLFAVFTDDSVPGEQALAQYRAYTKYFRSKLHKYSEYIVQCIDAHDIDEALLAKKTAAVLAVENAVVLAGDLDNLCYLVADGVKVVTLTWNGENELGRGSAVGGPLKPFGRDAVLEMGNSGILIDVSHLSDEGFADVMALCDDRVLATHSNARTVCANPRNLTDQQIQALAERDALIGLNLHQPFLCEYEDTANTFDALARHIDHMLALGCENNIAFGTDFDGAKMPLFCRDLTDIPAVYQHVAAHFGQPLADKLFFKNAKRYFNSRL